MKSCLRALSNNAAGHCRILVSELGHVAQAASLLRLSSSLSMQADCLRELDSATSEPIRYLKRKRGKHLREFPRLRFGLRFRRTFRKWRCPNKTRQ